MARQQNLGDTEDWFTDEDKVLSFEIYDSTEALIEDVDGWTIEWKLRHVRDDDRVLLTKSGSVTGSYSADPVINTQRTNITIADTDTATFQPGKYRYTLRRTDTGNETMLAYGDVTLKDGV